MHKLKLFVWTISAVIAMAGSACAQESLSTWVDSRVNTLLEEANQKNTLAALANQADKTKQVEAPSISSGSLIDKSSVPDFVSLVSQLAGLSKGSSTPTSITATAYAFKAFAAGVDLSDPAFYQANSHLRRYAFTVGYDEPKNKDGTVNAEQRGLILGTKILLLANREATPENIDPNNQLRGRIRAAFDVRNVGANNVEAQVTTLLFEALSRHNDPVLREAIAASNSTVLDNLRKFRQYLNVPANFAKVQTALAAYPEADAAVNEMLARNMAPYRNYGLVIEELKREVRKLQRKPQLAVDLQTKQRRGAAPSDYLAQLTFDRGLGSVGGVLAVNLGYGRKTDDTFTTGKGMRLAGQFDIPLNRTDVFDPKGPKRFSLSAEADRSGARPLYRAQAKLTLPIRPGIEVPISITTANRSEFIREGKVKGLIGVTFDLGKIDYAKLVADSTGLANALGSPSIADAPAAPSVTPVPTAPSTNPATVPTPADPVRHDLRVQVQALDGVPEAAPNLTVQVLDATGAVLDSKVTDARGRAYLSIPNYRADAARRFTVRIKYFGRVLETRQVTAGQADLAVQIGPEATN